MTTPPLYAPWRMDYIRSIDKPTGEECFLCQAAKASTEVQKRERIVLWTTDLSVVLINRYPYTNGHLLVAPRSHTADLESLSPEEQTDLMVQTTEAVKLLKRAM